MVNLNEDQQKVISSNDVERKYIVDPIDSKIDEGFINKDDLITAPEDKSAKWRHLIVGTVFVSLGIAAVSIGLASIRYRMTHIVVGGGVVNGRNVRLTAPKNGNLKAFYAKPGVEVKSGQILARIQTPNVVPQKNSREYQQQQLGLELIQVEDKKIRRQLAREKLAAEVISKEAEFTAAVKSLDFLKSQLKNLEVQYKAIQAVDIKFASQAVAQKKAALKAALAKATASRLDYRRFKQLVGVGAVSQQQLDKFRFNSESADAEVKEMQATLLSAQTALDSSQRGVALSNRENLDNSFAQQRSKLEQSIQKQQMVVNTLEAKLASRKRQLQQSIALSGSPLSTPTSIPKTPEKTPATSSLEVVEAPFNGVVYTTHSEQGEKVTTSQPILTLLNCNDLWVETLVKTNQATEIDIQKPAKIRLSNAKQTFSGEIDIIQPLSNTKNINQKQSSVEVKALSPMIPAHLVGKSLMRVKVRIPQRDVSTQSQRFCGVGQIAQLTFSRK